MRIPLFMLLLALCPLSAGAATVNAAVQVSATTIPQQPSAILEEARDNERDSQKDFRFRIFPTAAGEDEIEIRIRLTKGMPHKIVLEGKHADLWEYFIDKQSMLVLRPVSQDTAHASFLRSPLTLSVSY